MEWIRHGDVALFRVGSATHEMKKMMKAVTLAFGEITGHAHVLDAPKGTLWADSETEPSFIKVDGGQAVLTHQEHATVEIPEGTWRVVRQREFWGQERQVAD